MKKSLLLLFAMFATLLASAKTKVEINGIYYNINENNTEWAEVTHKGNSWDEFNEYSGSITIPPTVTYKGIEYRVTSIGWYAFDGCNSLTAINIPESVKSIGNYAFDGCSSLIDITVDCGNTVYDSRNDCNAIIETSSNTLIVGCSTTVIPESVTSIGSSAFFGCRSLTSITIPEGVTSIGSIAFYDCSSLTTITITKNSQLTSIEETTFYNCSSLTAINIPEGVTSIGNSAFINCTKVRLLS